MELTMEIVKHSIRHENGDLKSELECNFIFSPLSINTLLGIIACGLKPGHKLDRFLFLLGFKTLDDLNTKANDLMAIFQSPENPESPILSTANGCWFDKKFALNPNFRQLLQTPYKCQSFRVDFENKTRDAVEEINMFVEKATKGLIKDLVSEYDVDRAYTALIIANTIYFKGIWGEVFDPEDTMPKSFFKLDGETLTQVPFMNMFNEEFEYYASPKGGFRVLKMPYQGPQFAMYVFLPNEKDGLIRVLDELGSNPNLLSLNFELERTEIRKLSMPKFKFRYDFRVSDTLGRLGARTSLVDDTDILSLEALTNDIIPSDMRVFQSACIAVDECGTEAAAVEYVESLGMGLSEETPPPPIYFVADHPFIFMIREDLSKTPLFIGALVDPLKD